MKKITSYEIALSALSCALVVFFLTVGVYSEILLFTGYLFSGVALMLPLTKRSYRGYLLSYIGASVLGLIFNAARFWNVLPFIIFFGLHPLVNELQLKTKINTWVACFVKALWFDGSMYLIWRFTFEMTTTVALVDRFILPIILIVGTGFFIFYDYTMYKCRATVNGLAERFLK